MRVAMAYQFAHPHKAHQTLGDGVDADYFHMSRGFEGGSGPAENPGSIAGKIRTGYRVGCDYDVVIGTGTMGFYNLVGAKTAGASTLLYIADETLKYANSMVWRTNGYLANKVVGRVIPCSGIVKEWAQPYMDTDEIIYPPLARDTWTLFKNADIIESDEFRVVTAARCDGEKSRRKKNIKTICEGVTRVPGITLDILGEGHKDQSYADHESVVTHGFVDRDTYVDIVARGDVFLMAGLGDAFPTSVIEAVLAGTPAVVSETIGSRDIAPPEAVIKPTAVDISKKMEELQDAGADQILQAERETVSDLHTDRLVNDFVSVVEEIA
ncbi:Glycosyl transferases group 1 [Halorientalis persicus]|uniref:Glycosyl transferases group 1 n=1 Tax=Halorientalis persicus TaxID=1367881 RepID=A0A1H8W7Y0_9EURY|nr:glycosyltransferase [Halorientalis persicus]SEP23248.1 Glycosyl transferases group 1 [Halorientalis persicus]